MKRKNKYKLYEIIKDELIKNSGRWALEKLRPHAIANTVVKKFYKKK